MAQKRITYGLGARGEDVAYQEFDPVTGTWKSITKGQYDEPTASAPSVGITSPQVAGVSGTMPGGPSIYGAMDYPSITTRSTPRMAAGQQNRAITAYPEADRRLRQALGAPELGGGGEFANLLETGAPNAYVLMDEPNPNIELMRRQQAQVSKPMVPAIRGYAPPSQAIGLAGSPRVISEQSEAGELPNPQQVAQRQQRKMETATNQGLMAPTATPTPQRNILTGSYPDIGMYTPGITPEPWKIQDYQEKANRFAKNFTDYFGRYVDPNTITSAQDLQDKLRNVAGLEEVGTFGQQLAEDWLRRSNPTAYETIKNQQIVAGKAPISMQKLLDEIELAKEKEQVKKIAKQDTKSILGKEYTPQKTSSGDVIYVDESGRPATGQVLADINAMQKEILSTEKLAKQGLGILTASEEKAGKGYVIDIKTGLAQKVDNPQLQLELNKNLRTPTQKELSSIKTGKPWTIPKTYTIGTPQAQTGVAPVETPVAPATPANIKPNVGIVKYKGNARLTGYTPQQFEKLPKEEQDRIYNLILDSANKGTITDKDAIKLQREYGLLP